MSKRSEEKAKHLANFLSAIASACVNVGIIAPTIAYFLNLGGIRTTAKWIDLLGIYVMILIAVSILMFAARRILEEINNDTK